MPFVKQDYIIESKESTSGEKVINQGGNMNEYNNFIDSFNKMIDVIEKERAINPGAFLLSTKESELIKNSYEAFTIAASYYTTPDKPIQGDLLIEVINKAFDIIGKKNIKKIRELINIKFKNSFYWSVTPEIIQKEIDGIIYEFDSFMIALSISTETQNKYFDFESIENQSFFKAETMQARAAALGLSELYLFVTNYELNALKTISNLLPLLDNENTSAATEEINTFYNFVSTPITNVLSTIGSNARKYTELKEPNNKQISIFDFDNQNGIHLQLENIIDKQLNYAAVGDPNTDKLFCQIQDKIIKTGQQEFEISIDDFMSFRGLTDRKTANEKAQAAVDNLDRCRLYIEYYEFDNSLSGTIHFVQAAFLIKRPGRAGNSIYIEVSNKMFNHIINKAKKGQQFEKIDKKIMLLPDNQRTAYNIARTFSSNKRINAGRQQSNIISVNSLINACSILPLYPEKSEDAGKENYLRFQSEAPERIIKPFIKGLNFITEEYQNNPNWQIIKKYKFTKEKGGILTDAELQAALKDYKSFIKLNVEYELINEPNYTNLIEKRARHKNTPKAKKAVAPDPGTKAPAKDKPKPIKHTNPFKKEM